MTKMKLIGMENVYYTNSKPEYITTCPTASVHVYSDGVKYKVEINDALTSFREGMTEIRKSLAKNRKDNPKPKKEMNDKPVDTSNWYKPDEETFRKEIIMKLVLSQILIKDSKKYIENEAQTELLTSIVNSSSPSPHPILGNYTKTIWPVSAIYRHIGNKEKSQYVFKLICDKPVKNEIERIKRRAAINIWEKKNWRENVKIVHPYSGQKFPTPKESEEFGEKLFDSMKK